MLRFLIGLLIFFAIMKLLGFALRFWLRRRLNKFFTTMQAQTQEPASDTTHTTESTVRCAECGLFVAQSRALTLDTRYFCSEAHLSSFQERS